MSTRNLQEWLLSHHRGGATITSDFTPKSVYQRKAQVISVTGGKGGVGKTSIAIKIAKMLAENSKVLLLDCDYNLSNTHVKLGLPVNDSFYQLISGQRDLSSCLYRNGNFHLLSGCNGNLDLFENGLELDRLMMDIIAEHEHEYDYIILDCPAGLSKGALNLNAYSHFRIVVVTPDKSSITDSYSLMKILSTKYGITENHLLLNKISSEKQYGRLANTLSETVENFLQGRLHVLGGLKRVEGAVDLFDRLLLEEENSELHQNFTQVINKFTEKHADMKSMSMFKLRKGSAECHL